MNDEPIADKQMSHASYLTKVFNYKEQSKAIRTLKEILNKKNLKFDGFVVMGVSGITMGSILARSLRKELAIIRKPNDGSHSYYLMENLKAGHTYVFLDDLIASGTTYYIVKQNVKDKGAKLLGALLYHPQTKNGNPTYQSCKTINRNII
jgi:adenine/guanine phosphoribosyltransferase-like PRPP-binding protein